MSYYFQDIIDECEINDFETIKRLRKIVFEPLLTKKNFQKKLALVRNLIKLQKDKLLIYNLYERGFETYIEYGLITYFKNVGFTNKEISFIMDKKGMYITKKIQNSEGVWNNRVARLIMNDVIQNCEILINV